MPSIRGDDDDDDSSDASDISAVSSFEDEAEEGATEIDTEFTVVNGLA